MISVYSFIFDVIFFKRDSNPKKIAVCSNTTAQFGSTISISADFADGYKIDYWDSNGTISDIHEPETLLKVPSHDVYVTINAVPISYDIIFD